MSAHLTVYAMAIEAERPLRLQAAEQARLAAQAEAALERSSDTLLRRIGSAIRQTRSREVTADRWAGTGTGACSVGQLAS